MPCSWVADGPEHTHCSCAVPGGRNGTTRDVSLHVGCGGKVAFFLHWLLLQATKGKDLAVPELCSQTGSKSWTCYDPRLLGRRKVEITDERLLLTHQVPTGAKNQDRSARNPASRSNSNTFSEHSEVLSRHTQFHRYLFHGS